MTPERFVEIINSIDFLQPAEVLACVPHEHQIHLEVQGLTTGKPYILQHFESASNTIPWCIDIVKVSISRGLPFYSNIRITADTDVYSEYYSLVNNTRFTNSKCLSLDELLVYVTPWENKIGRGMTDISRWFDN